MGDVNPQNILVTKDGSVMLIDCDSFQVPEQHGRQPHPCVVGSPEYTAPEIEDFQRQFRSHDSDNFALAVLLYQLLGDGSHPYLGIDRQGSEETSNIRNRIKRHMFAHADSKGQWRPRPNQAASWKTLPGSVQNTFLQAFSIGATQVGRPTADTWSRILQNSVSESAGSSNPPPSSTSTTPEWSEVPRRESNTRIETQRNAGNSPSSGSQEIADIHRELTSRGQKKRFLQMPAAHPAMERSCPHCGNGSARMRRDWYKRTNALRCSKCKKVYGKTVIKSCPSCGSRSARLRRDWNVRGRPFRCRKCNSVYGGVDHLGPDKPIVGNAPNLTALLSRVPLNAQTSVSESERARGALIGTAYGNMLGLPMEGKNRDVIRKRYPGGVRDIDPRESDKPMDDDLAQSVELAVALLEGGSLPHSLAEKLIEWKTTNGRGMGRTTRQAINQLEKGVPPPIAAWAVYRAKRNMASAPNGGIMRCAPVAVARRNDPARLIVDTANQCAVTHMSPVSVWACVIVNTAIAMMMRGYAPNIGAILREAEKDGCPDLVEVGRKARIPVSLLKTLRDGKPSPPNVEWMRGNRGQRGHSVITMQAGLWAATTPLSAENALIAIINAGGDTDTNGALAGAALGVRYGASAFPDRWRARVKRADALESLGERLLRV